MTARPAARATLASPPPLTSSAVPRQAATVVQMRQIPSPLSPSAPMTALPAARATLAS
eukprot:CAMPEP_0119300316 /NCGR_PEP_ID=MMETSP1333-20130426/2271_1 /TAXON_ID=418940 /ORGANISM="Scyphosphaera apsteinii, Strain RCC1455" /LENGTH=57 /DNA_ID=CAMNT_0007302033 /DNA_START=12 /DNA_END=182 /DNA_ORIENTATION=+